MAQNRKPPAYQEYASELLANKHFRLMSLAERGLLYTLKLECWANISVPSKNEELAKYLSLTLNEFTDAYSARIQAFIEVKGDDLRIPEIDDYRNHLNERREKQSTGGKKGARTTNEMLVNKPTWAGNSTAKSTANSSSNSIGDLQHTRRDTNESLVEFKQAKSRKAQSVNNADTDALKEHQSWANDYDKASNGE